VVCPYTHALRLTGAPLPHSAGWRSQVESVFQQHSQCSELWLAFSKTTVRTRDRGLCIDVESVVRRRGAGHNRFLNDSGDEQAERVTLLDWQIALFGSTAGSRDRPPARCIDLDHVASLDSEARCAPRARETGAALLIRPDRRSYLS
jgi:hypothetical protein